MHRVTYGDMNFLVNRSLYMARGIHSEDSRAHLVNEALRRHNGEIDHDLVGREREPSYDDWK